MKNIWIFLIAVTLLTGIGAPPQVLKGIPGIIFSYIAPASHRSDIILNSTWRFHLGDVTGAQNTTFDDSSWKDLNLPYTWNNLDGQDGGNNYYRGTGWYRKHYTVSNTYTNRKFYLQFDGSNLVTDVYVNGTFLGEHQGGYAIARFDATSVLHVGQDNIIAVKVSNTPNATIAPLAADFTFFGGIYRDVHLIVTDHLHMRMTDYGSSGVYLDQSEVNNSSARLKITTKTYNDLSSDQSVTLRSVITDANNHSIQTLATQQTIKAHSEGDFIQNTTLNYPHLWNGREDPYLYHVFVQLESGNTVVDLVTQPLGFRFFRLDPNQGFFLNGHYLDLHGVNLHADHLNQGWNEDIPKLDQDMNIIEEMGANAVRLVHYQHDQYIYDRADHDGMITWTEIPLINQIASGSAFNLNIQQQLIELIRQNYNHPSIIFWGLGNEPHSPPDPNTQLEQLNKLAGSEDPGRITTLTICCVSDTNAIAYHTETRGYNKYFGWYYGSYNDFGSWASNLHQQQPSLTFAVSEYGAGASIYQHQEQPPQPGTTSSYHPEEYQTLLHEAAWQAFKTKNYIWGKFAWQMFDSISDKRQEGDTNGRNDKGLVTIDRQVRKDAFYWYKANWNTTPFVYITDRRFTQRSQATTDIKLYANTDAVTLTLNGNTLGSKTSNNHIFTWHNITLKSGTNTVQADGTLSGNTYHDEVSWHLNS